MKRDDATQAALDARHAAKAAQRFDAEPAPITAFGSLGDMTERPGQCVQAPVRGTERIAGREVIVERVGVLPPGTHVEWCAYFKDDGEDPQGYGATREEALTELAEQWAEIVEWKKARTAEERNEPAFDAPREPGWPSLFRGAR